MGAYFLYLIFFLMSLMLSFLFSGMEAGVFTLSRLRIRQQMKLGKHRAKVLYQFLENTENFLWTILIGNILANFIAITLVAAWLYQRLADKPLLLLGAFVVFVFLFYALCDLLPKVLFRLYPNRLCMAMAVPFRLLHLILSPIVAVVAWFSEFFLRLTGGQAFTGHLFGNRIELRMVMQESAANLTSEERGMINRFLDLQNLTVRSLTIPFDKASVIHVHTPVQETLDLFRRQSISRLPVRQVREPKQIVGIVSLDALLFAPGIHPQRHVGDFLQPALFLNENVRLEDALRRLQQARQRLGIVVGLDQRELGIISLQDILKTIFGDISL
jgi:putative hemolysin